MKDRNNQEEIARTLRIIAQSNPMLKNNKIANRLKLSPLQFIKLKRILSHTSSADAASMVEIGMRIDNYCHYVGYSSYQSYISEKRESGGGAGWSEICEMHHIPTIIQLCALNVTVEEISYCINLSKMSFEEIINELNSQSEFTTKARSRK